MPFLNFKSRVFPIKLLPGICNVKDYNRVQVMERKKKWLIIMNCIINLNKAVPNSVYQPRAD